MKKLVIMVIILIVVFGIVSLIQFQHIGKIGTGKIRETGKAIVNEENEKDSDTDAGTQKQDTKNIRTNIDSSTDSQTSSSTGEDNGETTTSIGCTEKQISYSVKKVLKNSICNEWQDDKCISKRVNCSIEVQNLDETTSGNFEVKFQFLAEDEEVDSIILNYFLNPYDIKIFEAISQIIGENADKEILCPYTTISIPEKKVC